MIRIVDRVNKILLSSKKTILFFSVKCCVRLKNNANDVVLTSLCVYSIYLFDQELVWVTVTNISKQHFGGFFCSVMKKDESSQFTIVQIQVKATTKHAFLFSSGVIFLKILGDNICSPLLSLGVSQEPGMKKSCRKSTVIIHTRCFRWKSETFSAYVRPKSPTLVRRALYMCGRQGMIYNCNINLVSTLKCSAFWYTLLQISLFYLCL